MGILATVQNIIDRAVDELGLERTELVHGLINQVGTQSLSLLNSLGEDLTRIHDWQFLERTAAFIGDGVNNAFALPEDFGRIVNQTTWSQNNKLPMTGPMGSQQWGWLQYGIVSVGVYYRYRILHNRMEIFPTPGQGERINFFYISKNWVQSGTSSDMLMDQVVNSADKPLFDRSLMIKGVKARLWAQKGFDTTVLAREYNDTLSAMKAQDQGAPEISLTSADDSILLDGRRNVPEGNW